MRRAALLSTVLAAFLFNAAPALATPHGAPTVTAAAKKPAHSAKKKTAQKKKSAPAQAKKHH